MNKERQIEEVTCGFSKMIYSKYQVDRYGIRPGKIKYDRFKAKVLELKKDLLDFGVPCDKLKCIKITPLPAINIGDIACPVIPDLAREFVQHTSSLVWLVQHNLYFNPSVTVVDQNGYTIDATVQYIGNDGTTLRITFPIPTSGTAYLS